MMKRIAFTGAVLIGAALSFNAIAAAPPTPEEKAASDVADRQAVFKLLRTANAVIGGQARSGQFNAEAAKLAFERIQVLGKMIPEMFAADTRSFKGVKTRSSDTIWDSKDDFAKLANDLVAAAKAAGDSAKSVDDMKAAAQTVGGKCGACHDRFRMN